jgi:hypothetical protein
MQQQGNWQLQEHLQQLGFQTTTVVSSKIEDSNSKVIMQITTGMLRRAKMPAKCLQKQGRQQQVQEQQQPVLRSRIQICWICN